jgi:FkbM family methyltransferase
LLASRLAQRTNDLALRSGSRGVRRGASLLRSVLISASDPTVDIDVEGFKLRARLSHEFPYYRRTHARYGSNVATLARLVCEASERPTMIDVGANIGDTVALARSTAPRLPILCIEGNQDFATLLKYNVGGWPDVDIEGPCLLADVSGTIVGHLASSRGTAKLTSGIGTVTRMSSLDDVLDRHPRFSSPALIKSDTDGFEARVIAGAVRTLQRAHPVLFLEYDPQLLSAQGSDGLALLERLRELGYGPTVVYDNFGDALCLTDLGNVRLFDDLDRYASRRPLFYFDLAVFPLERSADADELYRRETFADA